jgi:TrmH family RNA methyltransferase
VIRASAGSVFRVPLVETKLSGILDQMRELGLRLIATSSHKGKSLDQANLTGPLVVFIGSEGACLSHDLLAKMTEIVAIPQSPNVESLNAGVAASILLYEVARRKR